MKKAETAKGHSIRDIKHYYHCYFPGGRYPDEVSDRARRLFAQMISLGQVLLQWIDDHMCDAVRAKLPAGSPPLVDILDPAQTLLRILHYPAYKNGEEEPGAIRAAAHEDINLITVLPAGSSRGLQVFSQTTQQWYEVPCLRGSIIINIGDMLQEMTGGEYVATTHRVVKPDGEVTTLDRMATPCFLHAFPGTYLSEKYPTARLFLEERLRELGVL